jgi:hypothetical protein
MSPVDPAARYPQNETSVVALPERLPRLGDAGILKC